MKAGRQITSERLSEAEPGLASGRVEFAIYDTFTSRPYAGNAAGVLLLEQPMAASAMQRIATELGAPTTAFVRIGDVASVRYLTPAREIDACGHATLALATALVEAGIWARRIETIEMVVDTPAGSIPIRLSSYGGQTRIGLTYRPRSVTDSTARRHEVEACLGVRTDKLLPLEVLSTGLRHLIVPFRGVPDLSRLRVSQSAIADLGQRIGFETLCAFAPREGDPAVVRVRDLCGAIGAAEESASGTTSAALAHYLHRHGHWIRGWPIAVEQGVEMGRPSSIEVSLESTLDSVLVRVAGSAVKTISGWIVVE